MHKRMLLAVLVLVAVVALAVTIPLYLSSSPNIAPNESQLVKGSVVIRLNGESVRSFDNIITNAGFDAICDCVGNSTQPDNFDYIAVGSVTTAAAVTDTALETEITRELGTYSHTASTRVWTVTVTFEPGEATGAITESGVLNATTGGTLLCRQTFPVVNKGLNDTLEITWTFTLSQ